MSKELEALNWLLANETIYRGRTQLPISPALRDIKQRLESIDNANPSEALECFENMQYRIAANISTIEYTTIKQALLKAQEPKHYLKWEDLEFTRDEKVMIVKMGDTVYKVLYRCCDGIEEVQLLSEDEKLLCLNLIGKYKDNKQFFNDLHLERVE